MATVDGVNGTVCNAEQYQQSLSSYDNPNPSISCLTRGASIGLALGTQVSFLSLFCVVAVFIRIAWNVWRYRKTVPKCDRERKLFQLPADVYMFSLFAFDIVQALGGILDVRWIHNGIVRTGSYCTAQGIIMQVGEVGVALITLILAVHTFVAALWRVGLYAVGFACVMVGLACAFVALSIGFVVGIRKDYEVPTPYWCWIRVNHHFPADRLASDYIWLWAALATAAILYVPLYFWAEGRLSVDTETRKWYKFRMSTKPDRGVEHAQRKATLGILLYPLAYSFVVLPISVARWLQFRNVHVPLAAIFFADWVYHLSGALNVLLFAIIRPKLLLFTFPEVGQPKELRPRSANLKPEVPRYTVTYEHSHSPTATGSVDCAPSGIGAVFLGNSKEGSYV